jgi:nitroreductase
MDALEAIRKRRSVRKYTGDPIPREDLEKIVDAGRLAATGSNQQPWVAVVMDPSSRWWVEDGAAAVENMLIASTALGYGSCWLEGYTLPREEEFKKLLGIPEKKRLLTLVPIGVPAEWPTREKKALEEVLHWERY